MVAAGTAVAIEPAQEPERRPLAEPEPEPEAEPDARCVDDAGSEGRANTAVDAGPRGNGRKTVIFNKKPVNYKP